MACEIDVAEAAEGRQKPHGAGNAALPDDQILSEAGTAGRALVTANIKDFAPLDREYKAIGRTHAGLVLVSTRTFPQTRAYTGAIVTALDKLLTGSADLTDRVVFLER